MRRRATLTPLTSETQIYACPAGTHYHLRKACSLLQGAEWDRSGYVAIDIQEVRKRKLDPCVCAYTVEKEARE